MNIEEESKMLSFRNDIKVKNKYLKRLKEHRIADEIVKGYYWENGKGCAVGCTVHSNNHRAYEYQLGIPEWLARLEDVIFEGLPNEEAKLWPELFLKSIPVGVTEEQFEELRHKQAILRQKRNLKIQEQQYEVTPLDYLKQVIDAIKLVIKYHENPIESLRLEARSAARSATESARDSATWSAAYSASYSEAGAALYSAARSAVYSAAESAYSADSVAASATYSAYLEDSAEYSARSKREAVYKKEAKDLIKLLKELK